MSTLLQFAVPFATAFLVLGIFHAVAYLHIQLSEADFSELADEDESAHAA
jgi:hypothetical protein